MLSIEIIKQYLPLCWLKNNPLELTRSVNFFKQNLTIYFIVEYFMQANMTDDPFESFVEVTTNEIEYKCKNLNTFIQVTSSILVCSNVIAVFVIPVLIWLTVNEDVLSYYCLTLLFIWEFTVIAYILRKALTVNSVASLALSLVYFIFTYLGAFALGQVLV